MMRTSRPSVWFLIGLISIVGCFGLKDERQEDSPVTNAAHAKKITNSIGMEFVRIPKGVFKMGSPPSEPSRYAGEVQHQVAIPRDFFLGITEVTQSQYKKIMNENPSYFQGDVVAKKTIKTQRVRRGRFKWGTIEIVEVEPVDTSGFPSEQISWEEAKEFCRLLSARPDEQAAGRVYRLPTEMEWEYACRAGSETSYCFGDDVHSLVDYAWFKPNSEASTHLVGQKKPNAWGLYDMHGNVWEWCAGWHDSYPGDSRNEPEIPGEGADTDRKHVFRGGGYSSSDSGCRSALRFHEIPNYLAIYRIGFRVVCEPAVSED